MFGPEFALRLLRLRRGGNPPTGGALVVPTSFLSMPVWQFRWAGLGDAPCQGWPQVAGKRRPSGRTGARGLRPPPAPRE